jgi:hypothetical protein
MAATIDLRVRLIPWDDPAFVQAFEAAREQVRDEGLTINGPQACARAEVLIRERGFPRARIDCERTADEAMAHLAHWTVRRDGSGA